jgi:serine/threonine-protein kinase
MIELRTLGTLDLRAADGRELATVLAHSKRTALLAYLAVATPRGFHRRDALLALLWPELDQEHGRASLRKAVHHLRRSLGEDVLVGRGDEELGIRETAFWCDAAAVERALDAGETATALELYRGHFLEAFFLPDAPEFERWLERERARLRERAFQGAWAAAERETDAQNAFGAAYWGRRAAGLVPDDEGAVRRLIALLDRVGDRAGAVATYEEFARRLSQDYDVEPSVETRALVRAVRSRGGTAPVTAAATTSVATPVAAPDVTPFTAPPTVAPALPAPVAPASPMPAAVAGPRELPVPAPAPPPQPERKRSWIRPTAVSRTRVGATVVATVAALALVVAAWTARQRRPPDRVPHSASGLVVFPFSFQGSHEYAYLGDGMVSLLGTDLDGTGGLHVVDPSAVLGALAAEERRPRDPIAGSAAAARFGAGMFVLGDVVEAGGRLRVSAALYDGRRGHRPVTRAVAEGGSGELFALVDRVAAELLAGQREGRMAVLAARTTESLPALKAYLEGERQFRSGHYKEAVDAFQSAVAADSTFALAHYRLASAFTWASDTLARPAAARAARFSGRLSPPDRLLVEAFLPYLRGDADEAERRYREILSTRPFEGEAWYPLGEVLFHYNPVRGRSIAEARPVFERALALGPRDGPLTHLLEITAIGRDYAAFDTLLVGIDSGAHFDLVGRTVRAFTRGAEGHRTRVLAELRGSTDADLANSARHMLFLVDDRAAATRVLGALAEPQRPRELQAQGQILLAHVEASAGRWRAASAALRTAESLDRARALEHGGLLHALPFLPASRREIGETRDALTASAADGGGSGVLFPNDRKLHPLFRSYLIGLLDARLGEDDAARRFAAEVERGSSGDGAPSLPADLAHGVRARVDWERGRAADALAELRQTTPARAGLDLVGIVPFFEQPHERYLRAEALHALGRPQEALGWYASFEEHSPYGRVFLAPAAMRQGEIYEALGRPAEAAPHYARFLELWKDCDPELRPLLDTVRRRLERLQSTDRPPPGGGAP